MNQTDNRCSFLNYNDIEKQHVINKNAFKFFKIRIESNIYLFLQKNQTNSREKTTNKDNSHSVIRHRKH